MSFAVHPPVVAAVTRFSARSHLRPRLGGISFLHRFGSALNHHVHLHACVTDGVFRPAAAADMLKRSRQVAGLGETPHRR